VKKFKITKTIRSELRWYLLGLVTLLVFFYTYLLQEYFERGINISTKIEFDIIAREYNQKRINNPDTPLPKHSYLTTYRSWSSSPAEYQLLFPETEHQNNHLISIDKYQAENEESTQYIFMRYSLDDDQYLYLVAKYPSEMLNQQQTNEFENTVLITFPLAFLFIVAAVLLIYHLGRRLERHSNALNSWAENLSLESLSQEKPDFHYEELNSVANRLLDAFHRIGSLLEKEQLFLRFTSHELRTPLAITRANLELMDKKGISKQYENSILRIKRANTDMQHITEALLWLSRDSETIPEFDSIFIDDVLDEIINDHLYLLKEKKVDVEIIKCGNKVDIPIVIFKIIMSNLVRNSFQYTLEGTVIIELNNHQIILRNQNLINYQEQENDYCFGLGLVLVEKLIVKLGWKINSKLICGGRIVTVDFCIK